MEGSWQGNCEWGWGFTKLATFSVGDWRQASAGAASVWAAAPWGRLTGVVARLHERDHWQ